MARGLVTNTCSADTIALRMGIGPIQLLKQATPAQRRTLLAAALGWMLDAFDAMLYALVLAYVMRDLGMSKKRRDFFTRSRCWRRASAACFLVFLPTELDASGH